MESKTILRLLPEKIGTLIADTVPENDKLQEIRMRIGQPLMIKYQGQELSVCSKDRSDNINSSEEYRITSSDIRETLERLSGYSLYVFEEDIKQGFFTVQGGHRIGVAGKTIISENMISCMRYITFLNIRISHEVKGCADPVMPYLIRNNRFCHTLILSPPGLGKTTLLRDIIRQLSDGTEMIRGQKVGVVDERSEIAGCYQGVPQNDVGMRTDVLDCCPKTEGMQCLLRSMAPDIIAVDEIGKEADRDALDTVFFCGCKLLATAHGESIDDLRKNYVLDRMIRQKRFERYVLLTGEFPGQVNKIYDSEHSCIYSREKVVNGSVY